MCIFTWAGITGGKRNRNHYRNKKRFCLMLWLHTPLKHIKLVLVLWLDAYMRKLSLRNRVSADLHAHSEQVKERKKETEKERWDDMNQNRRWTQPLEKQRWSWNHSGAVWSSPSRTRYAETAMWLQQQQESLVKCKGE